MATGDTLDGKLVVLLGGSGFFGAHVAQELLARGARLRIASRRPERAFRLKPLAKLGQIQLARCNVARPENIRAAMAGADAAVYLAGSFSGDLVALHVDGAQAAAEAAKDEGAATFVHVSALGADKDSPAAYAQTKALGEGAVRAAFKQATVLRPSVLFGPDDKFLNLFAGLISALPVMPVFGADAKFQPLFVDDAAQAVAAALADPASHGGKIYEIAGPEVLTMGRINRMIAEAEGRKRLFVELPNALSALFAALPGTPMNRDQWALLKAGSTLSGKLPGLKKLGISPRPIELFLDRWMVRYRKHGRFAERLGTLHR
jgi:NADH dehydrogenase